MFPSVSVIVPCHNDAEYLAESIPSILEQRYPGDLEVLIVDDGSRPPASTLYSPLDPRVRFIRQEGAGAAAARNTGISDARGNYIAFLDCDDRMLPGRLERQVALLERCPEAGLAGGDITRRDLDGAEDSWGIFEAFGEAIPARDLGGGDYLFGEEFRESVLRRYPFNTSVMTVRQKALEVGQFAGSPVGQFASSPVSQSAGQTGQTCRTSLTSQTAPICSPVGQSAIRNPQSAIGARFDPDLLCWEDWDFVARIARTWRVAYCRYPVIMYRKRAGSITTTPNPRKFLSRARMFARWRRDFADLDEAQARALRLAENDSYLTASWEFRKSNRLRAMGCAARAFVALPRFKSLKSLAAAMLGRA